MSRKRKNANYHPDVKKPSRLRKRLTREARSIPVGISLASLIFALAMGILFTCLLFHMEIPEDFPVEERIVASCEPIYHGKGLFHEPNACLIRFEGEEAPYEPTAYSMDPRELADLLPPGTALRFSLTPNFSDLVYMEADGRVLLTLPAGLRGLREDRNVTRWLGTFFYVCAGFFAAMLLFRRAVLGQKAFENFHGLRYIIKQYCPSGSEKE